MKWEDLWTIVAAIITSVGGAGAIICGVSSLLTKMFANGLEAKYKQLLDKELENHKQSLEKELEEYRQHMEKDLEKYRSSMEHRRYVTKAQFDREFEIYSQLSKAFSKAKSHLGAISYKRIFDDYKTEKELSAYLSKVYNDAVYSVNAVKDVLFENAAFIPEDRYEEYEKIKDLILEQFLELGKKHDAYQQGNHDIEKLWGEEDEERYLEIVRGLKRINRELRDYLKTLVVLE